MMMFFFSSRRRHTRWPRDWSSDVCSSDLCFKVISLSPKRGSLFRYSLFKSLNSVNAIGPMVIPRKKETKTRSEERRVGKECREQWSPEQEKEKEKQKEGERGGEKNRSTSR